MRLLMRVDASNDVHCALLSSYLTCRIGCAPDPPSASFIFYVMSHGARTVQVLPALGEFPSEARLNLVIHHLRAGRVAEAEALVQDINPNTPPEYILKVSFKVCSHAVLDPVAASLGHWATCLMMKLQQYQQQPLSLYCTGASRVGGWDRCCRSATVLPDMDNGLHATRPCDGPWLPQLLDVLCQLHAYII